MNFIQEGNPFFMIPLFILLLLTIFLIVKTFKTKSTKNITVLKETTLFSLVFGLFGFIIGLIQVLDMIPDFNSLENNLFSFGLKTTILPPTLGTFIFLLGRFPLIIIQAVKKKPSKDQ